MKKWKARARYAALVPVVAAQSALAEPQAAVDVTDITGTITNQLTSMTAIQVALLSAVGLLVGFALIRRSLGR